MTALFWLCTGVVAAGDPRDGTIWIEMSSNDEKLKPETLGRALMLRLPERRVVSAGAAERTPICSGRGGGDHRLTVTFRDSVVAFALRACDDDAEIWGDTYSKAADPETISREVAVMAGLSLGAARAEAPSASRDERSEVGAVPAKGPPALPFGAIGASAMVTSGFRPGTTRFGGQVDIGVSLPIRLWIEAAFSTAMPYRGTADKNPSDKMSDITASVRPFSFLLGAAYRHPLPGRLWGAVGVFFSYTVFKGRDEEEDKHEVEGPSGAAGFAVHPVLRLGVRLAGGLSLVLLTRLDMAFGERRFRVRGEQVIDLGHVSFWGGAGLRFAF